MHFILQIINNCVPNKSSIANYANVILFLDIDHLILKNSNRFKFESG